MNTAEYLFSASSIKEYQHCGLKFKYGRVDKLPRMESPTHHRWFGSLVHNLIYTSIADSDVGLKSFNIREDGVDEETPLERLDRLWNENPIDAIDEFILKEIGAKPVGNFATAALKSLGQGVTGPSQEFLELGWKKEAEKMVTNGIKVLKNIKTIDKIEEKLFWTVLKRKFIGFIDVLGKDKDGKLVFYDFKTSFKKPSQAQVDEDFQFFAYSLALKDKFNLNYHPVGHYVHLRSGSAIPMDLSKNGMFPKMIGQLRSSFENLEDDLFFADYNGPLCAYCDFRHICYGENNIPEVSFHGN
jgi:CRISPR/Cas system-associated exonuclease Cas4 (RecB family)